MAEPKWTPGPWRVFRAKTSLRVAAEDYTNLAHVHLLVSPPATLRGEANARLIAVAPDLYEMTDKLLSILVGVLTLQRRGAEDDPGLREFFGREYPSVLEAERLLAAARGEA